MNAIKSFLTVFFVIVFTFYLNAQDKKVEVGIVGGYGYTMPKIKDARNNIEKTTVPLASFNINSDNLSGFHVGPILKFNFSELVSFQTGLLYNRFSGTRLKSSQAMKKLGTYEQSKTTLSAIDLPLRALYSLALADEFYVMLYAGPNINYALQKTTDEQVFVDNKLRESQSSKGENIYAGTPSHYSAFDLQMGAGMGIQYYKVSIRAGYDWGILNRTTYENISLRSNDIKVTIGYTF
ncbi:MAG: PorT family protein [Porphyromonadaceae bacterium]|jgi:hypothetical protein|nr:PorT family protein [Porphyromonadaceae bacterium]